MFKYEKEKKKQVYKFTIGPDSFKKQQCDPVPPEEPLLTSSQVRTQPTNHRS